MKTLKFPRLLLLAVFLVFFIIGLFAHNDYGVSADEPAMRKFGNDAFAYLFQGGPIPTELDWKFYNPAVQVLMRGIELGLELTDGADIWFMRHLVTFSLFFLTIALFYRIAWRRFRDWKPPLFGSLMFMLSPRLFAHGFYNPKDITALFFFTLSIWTMLRFLEKKTALRLIIHALCTALAISTRMFGLLIPFFTLIFLWVQARPRMATPYSLILFPSLTLALFLTWPLLWHSPATNFLGAIIDNTSRTGGGFYFGREITGNPWHYLPVWIGITTPIVYSILFLTGFFTGILSLSSRVARAPCAQGAGRIEGLSFLWFTLSIVALMILPIGIFNEWRHMLFLYPAFLLIALEGLAWLLLALKKMPALSWKIASGVLACVIGLQMLSTSVWMIRNHPFEYAYFSLPGIGELFDRDYWGLSYRAGLEWIIHNDSRQRIRIYTAGRVGKAAADTLPIEEWNRLEFVDPDSADYILVHRTGSKELVLPPETKLHSITVDGMELLALYRGPNPTGTLPSHDW